MRWNNHVFSPLKPVSKQSLRILSFDTEDNGTGAPHNFLCACFYDGNDGHTFWDRDEARRFMLKDYGKNTVFFAHNLAYDLTNLDYPEGDVELLAGGSRLIGGTHELNKRKKRFMDTGNFFVGKSIEQLGAMMGYPKMDYDITQHSGKSLDEISDEERGPLARYCMRDAEICYKVARYLFDLTASFNTRFKSYTAASLAMRIFRTRHLDRDGWRRRKQHVNDFERLTYYGGRTEVFDYRMFDAVRYEDITSSYPTAMRNEVFPHPSSYNILYDAAWERVRDMEGVSLVRLKIPYMHIPPLPHRRLSDMKLIFPYGEWTAAYTHPELRMAERHGAVIKRVYQSVVYDKRFRPFNEFIDSFYHKKETSTGIEREFYKLMLNGLSGKFGEKRAFSGRFNADWIPFCNCGDRLSRQGMKCDRCSGIVIEGCHISEPDSNNWVTIKGGRLPDPKHVFPILIAYITAYGRIKLYEERLSRCSAIYCDTDSCVSIDAPDDGLGKGLGFWERDELNDFIAFAPKFYRYRSGDRRGMKLKGVPGRAEKVYLCQACGKEYGDPCGCVCGNYMMESDMRYKFSRPMKLAEAIRRKMAPNEWHQIYKEVSFIDNKRVKLRSGRSKPIEVMEPDNIRAFKTLVDRMREYE